MTDRELLERAARAAGYSFQWRGLNKALPSIFVGRDQQWWNPLIDDGDARRLAVKLEMNIGNRADQFIEAWTVSEHDGGVCRGVVPKGDDACAATRRAIVRAAAAIAPEVA